MGPSSRRELAENSFRELDEVVARIRSLKPRICKALSAEDVDVYLFIQREFCASPDVSEATIFQFAFRNFYQLRDNLGSQFLNAYFKVFEKQRRSVRPDLQDIIKRLARVPTLTAECSLQFSFATKMAATIDQTRPIYDSNVGKVFQFKDIQNQASSDRIARCLGFYEHLIATTSNLLERHEPVILEINESVTARIDGWKYVSPQKKIDFILWTAGRLMQGIE
jgi:hypothetical protein